MRQSTHKKCTHSGCSSSRVVYHDCQLGNANDFTRLVCYHFRDPDVAHWNETREPVVEETVHIPTCRRHRNKVNLEEAVDQMSQMTASLIVLTAEETIEYMKQVPDGPNEGDHKFIHISRFSNAESIQANPGEVDSGIRRVFSHNAMKQLSWLVRLCKD